MQKNTFNIFLGCMEAKEARQIYLVYMLSKEKRCLGNMIIEHHC